MRRLASVFRYAAPAAGFGYGLAVIGTFPQRTAPWFLVWAAFALVATTVAGVVFAYGLSQWHELQDVLRGAYRLRARAVAGPVTSIVAGSVALVWVTELLPGPSHASPRAGLVATFAIAAAAPGAGAMYGIRRAAIRCVPCSRGT